MATDYYQDDENKKKRRGGQGNKGRQPGSTGAPQTPKKPSNGGSTGGSTPSTTSNEGSTDWGKHSKTAGQAADVATTLGKNLGNHQKYSNVKSWSQGEVKDEGVQSGMDVTQFNNAYGSRNADNTGVDMRDLKAKDLELTPAEKES